MNLENSQQVMHLMAEVECLNAALEREKVQKDRVYTDLNIIICKWEVSDIDDEEIGQLCKVLKDDYGFTIHYIYMPDSQTPESLCETITKCMQGHETSESLWLFYYSGHGVLSHEFDVQLLNDTLMWSP